MNIPFFRPHIGNDEIDAVVNCLKSGWLTTGPQTKQFEADFARYVGSKHAVALNSATAALHLALEAIGLSRGDSVLVPAMTFAATAEVVRYFDAKPILVDCRADDLNLDLDDAERRLNAALKNGERVKAIMPVHYGGQAVDVNGVVRLARSHGLRIIEDAAHCCPAYYRDDEHLPWKHVGSEADVCCYSFYANKCITTAEGGMACTDKPELAERMQIMGLHGISKDAWKRFTSAGSWYYEIVAPGFKYNLTDIASSIGLQQLKKADRLHEERAEIAAHYGELLKGVDLVEPLTIHSNRMHSWHLYVIKLKLEGIRLGRSEIIDLLRQRGIMTSVHWIPLHMHPYYKKNYGYKREDLPIASAVSDQLISLPIFPGLRKDEVQYVVENLSEILAGARR